MDTEAGITTKNNGPTISYQLPPYGSVLLFASTNRNKVDTVLTTSPVMVNPKEELLSINKWNITGCPCPRHILDSHCRDAYAALVFGKKGRAGA